MSALLEVESATVEYRRSAGARLRAVDAVSLSVARGEILGLVGESGCGKSSLGRAIVRLVPLAGGAVRWHGRRVDALARREFRPLRQELQIVFQDPQASFDPRMTIADSVAEPLRALARGLAAPERSQRVGAVLADVGLTAELGARYPHQLSGGQLQRAGLARALVVRPGFVVFDEPVSALDVSVQGQIVNLIAGIRRELGLAGLFISHNLAVVAHLAERISVMYRGRIAESASTRELLRAPLHPYTRLLLDSVPCTDPAAAARLLARRSGAVASDAGGADGGCPFAARCPHAVERCRQETPLLRAARGGGLVACHRADEWLEGLPAA